MNTLFVAFLIITTTISCVALGVACAYCVVTGLLAALNPTRPQAVLATLAHESPASGD